MDRKVIIMDHPLIQHKLSILRDVKTSTKEFRDLVNEIAMLMIYDATKMCIRDSYVGEADKESIHTYLSEKLPVFMIPNVFNQIDEMPLTQNGKIDRKLLLASCGGRR